MNVYSAIDKFMNWAAFHIANREEHQEVVQYGRFLYAETGWDKKIISKRKKKGLFQANFLSFLWGMMKNQVTDCLTGTVQKILDSLIQITVLLKIQTLRTVVFM